MNLIKFVSKFTRKLNICPLIRFMNILKKQLKKQQTNMVSPSENVYNPQTITNYSPSGAGSKKSWGDERMKERTGSGNKGKLKTDDGRELTETMGT
ncbi:MAG: hypothetical protein LBR53_06750 [Deltaproteobacteria bacterium]|jgi:hypothetical protein|nr:hypothetical protein [Deltaproteobacteria bacterium]